MKKYAFVASVVAGTRHLAWTRRHLTFPLSALLMLALACHPSSSSDSVEGASTATSESRKEGPSCYGVTCKPGEICLGTFQEGTDGSACRSPSGPNGTCGAGQSAAPFCAGWNDSGPVGCRAKQIPAELARPICVPSSSGCSAFIGTRYEEMERTCAATPEPFGPNGQKIACRCSWNVHGER